MERFIGRAQLDIDRIIKVPAGTYGGLWIEIDGLAMAAVPPAINPLFLMRDIIVRFNSRVVSQVNPFSMWYHNNHFMGRNVEAPPINTTPVGSGSAYNFYFMIPCTSSGHGSALFVNSTDECLIELPAFMDFADGVGTDAPMCDIHGELIGSKQMYRFIIGRNSIALTGNDVLSIPNPMTTNILLYPNDYAKLVSGAYNDMRIGLFIDDILKFSGTFAHLHKYCFTSNNNEYAIIFTDVNNAIMLDLNPTKRIAEAMNSNIVFRLETTTEIGNIWSYTTWAIEWSSAREKASAIATATEEAKRANQVDKVILTTGVGDFPKKP
jgi:hypothetical protein